MAEATDASKGSAEVSIHLRADAAEGDPMHMAGGRGIPEYIRLPSIAGDAPTNPVCTNHMHVAICICTWSPEAHT